MPYPTQELALLLKMFHDAMGGGVPGGEENGVQYLSSTRELVTFGLVDSSVGANANGVVLTLDEVNLAVVKVTLNWQMLCHGCLTVGTEQDAKEDRDTLQKETWSKKALTCERLLLGYTDHQVVILPIHLPI